MPDHGPKGDAPVGESSTQIVKRLCLRQPSQADLAAMWSIFGDPRTSQFSPGGPIPGRGLASKRLGTWIQHWKERGFGYWAVSETSEPEAIVGFGGLLWRTLPGYPDGLHLGYRLAHNAWGRGLATELGEAAMALAQRLGHPDVLAVIAPGNTASIRVVEKLGMRQIGDVDDLLGYPPSLVFKADL